MASAASTTQVAGGAARAKGKASALGRSVAKAHAIDVADRFEKILPLGLRKMGPLFR